MRKILFGLLVLSSISATAGSNYGFNNVGVCVKISNGRTTVYNVNDSYCSSNKNYGFSRIGVCKKVTAYGRITAYNVGEAYCDEDYGFNKFGDCVKLDYQNNPTVYQADHPSICDYAESQRR